jgi:DNA-binding CsgD family transcriptional regulator/tetratricopeptide (TPR) repeat protein
MELLEREKYLNYLTEYFHHVESQSGHSIFMMGEAGVGKTSLVNHFLKKIESKSLIYLGACDSLFTPRPLGPLFDIAEQFDQEFLALLKSEKDRSIIFGAVLRKLSVSTTPVVLVFEDIHWADEATIDLIKFLARRIHQYKCLFLLTYRDDEIHAGNPLATIFGELPTANFSKILVDRFSKVTVDRLAVQKGYASGDRLYALTGGNPFYVTEILASYSPGIPERVKDSVLTVFHGRSDATRALWEFLSILPTSRIELNIAKRIENDFANSIDACISSGIIVSKPGHLSFKHELFRLAIEESLPPIKRSKLHKRMLDIIMEVSAETHNWAQLVHHAKYADERELVVKFAPHAARQAASVGAHIQAAKLYATAIEYTHHQDPGVVELYEAYAYECYLTNQIATAIPWLEKALDIWRERRVSLKEGDTLRFLSKLWYFEGEHRKAMELGLQSIQVLENGFPTRERAQAYSNLSQLTMLSDDREGALLWGNKAIDLATRMDDHEILSHALNNVGYILFKSPSSQRQGEQNLNDSLSIALRHGFHEHAARAYANLFSSLVLVRQYESALKIFDAAVKYCEERDLSSWKHSIISSRARVLLETGHWNDAEIEAKSIQNIANNHVKVEAFITLAKIDLRRGKFENARRLITEARIMAIPTREPQWIVPVLTASLELAWITGGTIPVAEIESATHKFFHGKNNSTHYSELAYWMRKCGLIQTEKKYGEFTTPAALELEGRWKMAAEQWKTLGCPYEEALALFDGDEDHQKAALLILHGLGASATHEMLKAKLKRNGVKNIPRGLRESTRSNPAQLTNRQIDVLILLQDGLQNIEIANRLFISPKTVDHHVSTILSKLNVTTRGRAVTEARKLGIVH